MRQPPIGGRRDEAAKYYELALAKVVRNMGGQLVDVGDGIIATTRYLATADAETEAAFKKEGGKLA